MMKRLLVVLPLIFASASAQAQDFSSHWHDGRAEIDGYRLQVSRYGQIRTGEAVMIFVTEPFSRSKRVKVDDHTRNPDDVVDVLKLNLVRDFQTGIYDYNTMVSVFADSRDFRPLKISFSSAEWCGHVYSEILFDPGKVTGTYHSYFEGESGDFRLDRADDAISEDNLFILLRGLRKDFLGPGEAKTLPLLAGTFSSRLSHQPPRWTQATITRGKSTQTVSVPAGEFETVVYDLRLADGRVGQFYIESSYPHRIVKWMLSPDVEGVLTGSARLAYWRLNEEGHERYLADIGLGPAAE